LHGKPETSCELRGASIKWAAKEISSKKNVIELETFRVTLLLQHEDNATIGKWLDMIKCIIEKINTADPLDITELQPDLDQGETSENHKQSSKKKKKEKKKSLSRHGSDAKSSDKVRSRLKKFISKRPTMESLKESGIIKDNVFGCSLETLCGKEKTTIPNFIRTCVSEVERRGLEIDGIYRVSGNLSHIQRLRYLTDRDETPNLSEPEWEDIHLVTGALKMYLRELPEPIIPYNLFIDFISACKKSSQDEKIKELKAKVNCLPKCNYDTLKYLLQHFKRVVEHSDRNRMQAQNLAIVFGPTLLNSPPHMEVTSTMAIDMMYQNQIIDIMINEYHVFF